MLTIAADDVSALRRFGWQMAIAVVLLFGLLLPWLFGYLLPWWPWWLAAALLLLAFTAPKLLYWPSRFWLAIASVLGWLNTRVLLALVFYLVVTPLGWLLRLLGKLDYQAAPPAANSTSFWRKAPPLRQDDMKDPF